MICYNDTTTRTTSSQVKEMIILKNLKIRNALVQNNMKQWQLADYLGISEYTLCKKLRKELPEQEQERIIEVILEKKGGE